MAETIGILGAGQLGQMLALAGIELGLRFRFLDPASDPPAAATGRQIIANFDDASALREFYSGLRLVSYEFENVPTAAFDSAPPQVSIFPPIKALATSQDRLSEKSLCRELGIPTNKFMPVSTLNELKAACRQIGLPAVLKTRRLGYDGKGQAVLKSESDLENAFIAMNGAELILESFVSFKRELSIIAVRSSSGEKGFYPLVENTHRSGILRKSLAPAPATSAHIAEQAQEIAGKVLDHLAYIGVLTIELFDLGGTLLFNEMAPRVHNSGHWTIEGAQTSQFENHLRAITGMALGSCQALGASCMLNFIGRLPNLEELLKIPGGHLHLYGKSERRARKLGHFTLVANNSCELEKGLALAENLINDDG